MADVLWTSEFKEVASKHGTALVWPKGLQSLSTSKDLNYMEPQTYARYVAMEAVDLHFEGFNRYASGSTIEKFAHSVTGFLTDDINFASIARDIGGGYLAAGIAAS